LSIEKAREHLKKWNLDHRIMEFDVSSATVELAAQAVNCEPERIAKSMAFLAEINVSSLLQQEMLELTIKVQAKI